MPRHILDLPLDITENIIMLGCETNALEWFYPGIYDGCNDIDDAFPFFEVLEHPCIRVMSQVCREWEASVTSSVKKCRWFRFKRIELHAKVDLEDPDLVIRINKFVRALQLSSSSAYKIPLYVNLRYPDPVYVEESLIRLFMHGVGKLLPHVEHIHSLEVSLDQTGYAASHVFWLLFALSQRGSNISFVNVSQGNYTATTQMSILFKATIKWSLGLYQDQTLLSAASQLRQKGNHFSIPKARNGESGGEELEAMNIRIVSSSICRGMARCLQILGELKRIQGDYEEARGMFEEAKIEHESLGDRAGVAHCLHSLGDIKCMQGDYEEARGMFEEARVEHELLGDRTGVAHCLRGLGDIKRMQGDYGEARWMFEEAKIRYELLGDFRGAANCLWNLGDIKRLQGDYREAREMLEEAKFEYEILGDRIGVANCLWSLGNIKYMQGAYEGARGMSNKAMIMYESLGNRSGTTICLRSLSKIKSIQGDYEGARRILEDAKIEYESRGNRTGVADCLWDLGDIKHTQGDYKGATEMLEKARTEFASLGDHVRAASCLKRIGDIRCMQHDQSTGGRSKATRCLRALRNITSSIRRARTKKLGEHLKNHGSNSGTN